MDCPHIAYGEWPYPFLRALIYDRGTGIWRHLKITLLHRMEKKRIDRPSKLHCDKPGIDCDTCICDMIAMKMRYYDVIDGIKGPHLLQ